MKSIFFKITCLMLVATLLGAFATSSTSIHDDCCDPTTKSQTASHEHCSVVCHVHLVATILSFETLLTVEPIQSEDLLNYLYSSSYTSFNLLSIFRPPIA